MAPRKPAAPKKVKKAVPKKATEPRLATDWEAVEPLYRAGQLSIREIAKRFGVTDTAVHKKAKALGWERDLAEKVRKTVRAKLVRTDGLQAGSLRTEGLQPQRARDAEIVDNAANVGVAVITTHRKDLQQLSEMKRILTERMVAYLNGETPDKPFKGENESPADVLEKLSRVTARIIPLQRQAFNLDDAKNGDDTHEAFLARAMEAAA